MESDKSEDLSSGWERVSNSIVRYFDYFFFVKKFFWLNLKKQRIF